jgi:hypothetical protein
LFSIDKYVDVVVDKVLPRRPDRRAPAPPRDQTRRRLADGWLELVTKT